MTTLELIGTAIALAMDAFAVAIASGISLRRVTARQTFRLAFHFGLFQALMPVTGWGLGRAVIARVEGIDHWIAFALLAFVGARMVRGAMTGDDSDLDRPDPTRGTTLVLLSIATSIDALAVGFGLSLLRVEILWPALLIGLVCLSFTTFGLHLGGMLGSKNRIGRWAELAGGLILLAIGLNILREHGALPG